MKYLLRGGPLDDQCKSWIGEMPDSIQHTDENGRTIYLPTDETFELDGETVLIYEPQIAA